MRERWQRWLGVGMVLCGLLSQGERPLPVQAQTTNSDDEIVYLDTGGFIRVLDPQVTSGQNAVQWVSPVGGWRDFALGDFNNDGDAEIVAVGGESTSGKLVIYDPVIAAGRIDSTLVINAVPWTILYETALLGAPLVVSAGDLVPTVAGDEIAYVFALNPADRLDPDDLSRLAVLQMATGVSDGSDWEEEINFADFGNDWDRIALGDLDNIAGEEIVLVDRSGLVRVYRVYDQDLGKFFENESGARPWQDGIAAHWSSAEQPELLMARSSSPGGATFWTFYYDPSPTTNFRDGYTELLLPTPRTLFAGDINGNGEDELFFLRSVPSNITTRMRLFMRNAGDDTLPVFEQLLDTDNGYQGGAAGDTDGDGRAEVVVIRNNNIRIYTAPEGPTAFTDNTLTILSDGFTIDLANLDRNGVVVTPNLTLSNAQLNPGLVAGADPTTLTVSLNNTATGTASVIPFTAAVVGRPSWIIISPSAGTTPATLSLSLDPGRLATGTYTATIAIDSSNDQVLNLPLALTVVATVRAGLMMSPDRPPTLVVPCAADSAPQQQTIRLTGPTGITFVARVQATSSTAAELTPATAAGVEWPSTVTWLSATSPNVLPTTMVLTFSPAAMTTQRSTATVQLSYADEQGTQTRTLDVSLFCATDQIFLPLIPR